MTSEQPGWRNELVTSVDDPDFGALDLWRETLASRTPPVVGYTWRGEIPLPDGLFADFSISGSRSELDRVGASYRTAFRGLVAHEADARKRIAERIMPLAAKWAESIDISIANAEALAGWLKLNAISISPDSGNPPRIALWYEERTHDIFAGHSILAYFNMDGELIDADLAG